ncbi:MAG: MBL fold metallo-hydrolase [Desulfomonile tiedjei]|uniref:MBL fold metallo-hydrolase n=1 Tax=Desulfomonile tiedjei TaxID=2358 RepID=A0A9D6V2R5_9BACT|nr:MBL fold metallo-hydrolase [Desulfomonile tiedjei]
MTIPLAEIDEARITIIIDNNIDFLIPSTGVVRRFEQPSDWYNRPLPRAEHGFSALISLKRNGNEGTVLLDTGASADGVQHNFEALEIDIARIQAIILSHGHFDHAMGLARIVDKIGNQNLKIVLHPDVYLQRKAVFPNGKEVPVSIPPEMSIRREDVEIVENTGPMTLLDGSLLVSGEIPRTTDFEKGFPIHYAKREDVWQHDPLIMDDQCIILRVKGKGLVIVTGCGHAGIINTIRYAQELTGVSQVYALIGGFHLTGGLFEKIIPATIAELEKISPRYIMPGHCTGWSAVHRISEALPDAFITSSVGTTLIL